MHSERCLGSRGACDDYRSVSFLITLCTRLRETCNPSFCFSTVVTFLISVSDVFCWACVKLVDFLFLKPLGRIGKIKNYFH